MVLLHTVQQSETRAKFGMHPLRRIPHDLQATAPARPARSKARHYGMPFQPHGTPPATSGTTALSA